MNQLHEYQVSIREKLLFCFCGYLGSSNSSGDRTEGLAEGPVRDGTTRHGRQDDVRAAQRSQRCAAAVREHARQHVRKVSFAFPQILRVFICMLICILRSAEPKPSTTHVRASFTTSTTFAPLSTRSTSSSLRSAAPFRAKRRSRN